MYPDYLGTRPIEELTPSEEGDPLGTEWDFYLANVRRWLDEGREGQIAVIYRGDQVDFYHSLPEIDRDRLPPASDQPSVLIQVIRAREPIVDPNNIYTYKKLFPCPVSSTRSRRET